MSPERPYVIALVGRPNVGKSSLFNALLGFRRTIVLDAPGTTRDEVAHAVKWSVRPLHLTDMQGIWDEGDKGALEHALSKADACLFVVDAASGPTPFDRWIAGILRESRKPVQLLVNKTDARNASAPSDFAVLGYGVGIGVSAAHRRNIDEVREWCLGRVGVPAPVPMTDEEFFASENKEEKEEDEEPKPKEGPLTVALVGRPNTGKSTLMNRLCHEAVSRVSAEPHTTRDPVMYDIATSMGPLRLVDTAGVRRPRSKKELLEIYSIQATTRQIHRADVVLLLLDASQPINDQDMRLMNLIEREGKPVALLLNFWDRLSSADRKKMVDDSDFRAVLEAHKRLAISGLTGLNVDQIFSLAFRLAKVSQRRVRTARLNRFVEVLVTKNPPPSRGRANFNILYASQVRVDPPTFVFFLNRKEALPASYQKYVENSLRKYLGMAGQTIRIHFRANERG